MSLNQLFDKFLGSQQPASNNNQPAGQSSGGPSGKPSGGASDILAGITNNVPGGLMGGLAAGALLGVLVGNKKARKTAGKMAGGAVGLGGAAFLGAVAFNAFKNWKSGVPAAPQPNAQAIPAPVPIAASIGEDGVNAKQADFDPIKMVAKDGSPFQLALIKAMIGAANADGHIDRQEQSSIFDAVNKLQMEATDKAIVFDALQNPPEIGEIASSANGLEQASEIYLVSRMAIDPDRPSEQAYLYDLAVMMSLPQELVQHLELQISQQQ